jgi:arylsulfatase A-like enzyme
MVTRREFLLGSAGAVVASALGANAAEKEKAPEKAEGAAPKRPNLILITPDQMRGDAMGCAGNPIVRTPNLDKLAAAGILFRNAFCQNPVCVPSRVTIYTGRYPHAHGVKDNGVPLTGALTLPALQELLAGAGYRTVSVGKMHFWPNWRVPFGFEKRVLVEDKAIGFADDYRLYLKEKGLSELSPDVLWRKLGREYYSSPLPEEDHIDSFIGRNAVEIIREKDDRPLFLWVGFPSPHGPVDPPKPWSEMYRPEEMRVPQPEIDDREWETKPPEQKAQLRLRRFFARGEKPRFYQRFLASYYGLISLIDKWVGEMVRALRQKGELENTLLIFNSDHGEYAGDHGLIAKDFSLYESLVHIPFLAHWPAGIGSRGGSEAFVENVDLLPTFLDYAGVKLPWGAQGYSLRPLFEGKQEAVREFAFAEYWYLKMLRTHDWKLICYAGKPYGELYELREDPGEKRNRYADPACRQIRDDLTFRLLGHLVATEYPGIPPTEGWYAKPGSLGPSAFIKDPSRGST